MMTAQHTICLTCTIVQNYKKALAQRDKALQIQQEIIDNLKRERKKLLEHSLN